VLIKDYIISGIIARMLASDVVDLWFESQSCRMLALDVVDLWFGSQSC
jgi:hypothetical protein